MDVYAAYCLDENIRLKSSSGGMITILAEHILAQNGAVYGVAMSEDCYSAEFIRITDSNGLEKIRGSKYLQAKLGNTFRQVKEDLESGRTVLFTGTGCQVNGLKAYLGKAYEKLYCVDVICHGAPSPELWREYVEFREKEYDSKVTYVSFRCKDDKDWNGFNMKEIDASDKVVHISRHVDPYFSLFVSNLSLRPSCYECLAKKLKQSDLTVADFWGIDNVAPEMNDNKGISLVIVRSEKGKELFAGISERLTIKSVSYEDGVRDNKAEYQPYPKPLQRDSFFKDMNRMPFEELSKKYLCESSKTKVKKIVKSVIKKLMGGGKMKVTKYTDYWMCFVMRENHVERDTDTV